MMISQKISTTHVGSLPRPDFLIEAMTSLQTGGAFQADHFSALCDTAVRDIVAKQVECGIDVVSDGEMSKISYVGYVGLRLGGLENDRRDATKAAQSVLPTSIAFPDIAEHPDYAAERARIAGAVTSGPACAGQLSYAGNDQLQTDIQRLKSSTELAGPISGAFMTSASPGVLAMFIPNYFYQSEDEYVTALAHAMQSEYEQIHKSGLMLQIDCPDLAMSWHMRYWAKGEQEFLKIARRNLEALNYATRNIPGDAIRMHLCWGNYGGPHTYDLPIAKLFDLLRDSRPAYLLFEAANPRHEHEWEDWKSARVPDDKILVPGLIDTTTNIVEHPRLVAQRLVRYAGIVGSDRVMAGTDCGFGTFALRHHQVFPTVVWSKLRALSQGARIASDELYNK